MANIKGYPHQGKSRAQGAPLDWAEFEKIRESIEYQFSIGRSMCNVTSSNEKNRFNQAGNSNLTPWVGDTYQSIALTIPWIIEYPTIIEPYPGSIAVAMHFRMWGITDYRYPTSTNITPGTQSQVLRLELYNYLQGTTQTLAHIYFDQDYYRRRFGSLDQIADPSLNYNYQDIEGEGYKLLTFTRSLNPIMIGVNKHPALIRATYWIREQPNGAPFTSPSRPGCVPSNQQSELGFNSESSGIMSLNCHYYPDIPFNPLQMGVRFGKNDYNSYLSSIQLLDSYGRLISSDCGNNRGGYTYPLVGDSTGQFDEFGTKVKTDLISIPPNYTKFTIVVKFKTQRDTGANMFQSVQIWLGKGSNIGRIDQMIFVSQSNITNNTSIQTATVTGDLLISMQATSGNVEGGDIKLYSIKSNPRAGVTEQANYWDGILGYYLIFHN